MRVKVTKCNGDEWYKDCIDKEFQVSESRQEDMWVARLEPKDRQMVEGRIYGLIKMEDCEIVEDV